MQEEIAPRFNRETQWILAVAAESAPSVHLYQMRKITSAGMNEHRLKQGGLAGAVRASEKIDALEIVDFKTLEAPKILSRERGIHGDHPQKLLRFPRSLYQEFSAADKGA